MIKISADNARKGISFVFIVIGLIFWSGHSYFTVCTPILKVLMLLICAVGCIILSPYVKIHRKVTISNLFIWSIVVGALFSFFANYGKNIWLDPIMMVSVILIAYCITDRIPFGKFRYIYGNILAILTIIAIIVALLVNNGIEIPAFIYKNLQGRTYNTIWICTWSPEDSRLMGPFWEPGLLSSFLLFGLVLETIVFRFEKSRMWVLITLIAGILFSQSAAGYLLLLLVLFIWFQKSRKIHVIWDILAIIVFFIGLYFQDYLTLLLYQINPDVFWKLTTDSITGNTRFMSPIVCFKVFLDNPIFGNGLSLAIEKYNLLKTSVDSNMAIDALTSTNAFFMSAFGIWGISYTITWVVGIIRTKCSSILVRILLFLLIMVILNKEPHYNLMITYVLMFYLCKAEYAKDIASTVQ